MIGNVIGNYKIIDKIGEGGMGAVYKALHTKMDRVCAIKLLLSRNIADESSVARFYREARIASRINSPHAATIYDFGETDDGLLYLAMEYIDGRTLGSVLASESPLDAKRAIHIAGQVSTALSVAHALGIVHRDLKPDNIMITTNGTDRDYVKVLDFGIAKTLAHSESDAITKTGFLLGTPIYMSPEQVSGRQLDERSDVYSLALIVYQMLSARLPFEGDNLQSIMIERVTSDPIRLRVVAPEVSESLEQAVMAGLARDPGTRTRNAELFASSLGTTMLLKTAALGSAPRVDERVPGLAGTHSPTSVPLTRSTAPALPTRAAALSTELLENRLAAQAWLYNKLNWKTYSGALAGLLIAVAVSMSYYVSKTREVLPSNESVAPAAEPSRSAVASQPGQDQPSVSMAAAQPPSNKRRNKDRTNVAATGRRARGPDGVRPLSEQETAVDASNTNKPEKLVPDSVTLDETRATEEKKGGQFGGAIKGGFKKLFGGGNKNNNGKKP